MFSTRLIRNTQGARAKIVLLRGGGGEMGEKEALERGWNEGGSLHYKPRLQGEYIWIRSCFSTRQSERNDLPLIMIIC